MAQVHRKFDLLARGKYVAVGFCRSLQKKVRTKVKVRVRVRVRVRVKTT